MARRGGKLIRASEVGEYVYCARAWRLRKDGFEPTASGARFEAGRLWHAEHGEGVRRARHLRALAAASLLLALLLATLIALLWWSE